MDREKQRPRHTPSGNDKRKAKNEAKKLVPAFLSAFGGDKGYSEEEIEYGIYRLLLRYNRNAAIDPKLGGVLLLAQFVQLERDRMWR